jgi:acyl dehydratase
VYTGEPITFTAEVVEVDPCRNLIVYVTTAATQAGEEVCRIVCRGMPTAWNG